MRVLSGFIRYYYVLCCHGNDNVLCSPNVFVVGNIHLIVDKHKNFIENGCYPRFG